MYPENELNRLAAFKTALRRDIARRRVQCAGDTARVLRPLAWADRVVAVSRKLRPLAAVATAPVIAWAMNFVLPRQKLLCSLLRWGPLVVGALGTLNRRRARRSEHPL